VQQKIAETTASVGQFTESALDTIRRQEQVLLDRAQQTGRARDVQAAARATEARFRAESIAASTQPTAAPTGAGSEEQNAGARPTLVSTYVNDDGFIVQVFSDRSEIVTNNRSGEWLQRDQEMRERRQNETNAQMQEAAATERRRTAARDELRLWLSTFFEEGSAEYQAAKTYIDQQVALDNTPDAVFLSIRGEKFYQIRFKGNEGRRAAGLAEYSPAEYLQAENAYSEALRRFGLERLATRDTFGNLIGGMVSPDELAERVTTVYDRIQNADAPLRAELQRLKTTANLTDQDLAETLLLGKEGAASLQRKIAQAEIRAEATTRGLTSRLGDVELERRGITRAQAAAGFEQVATELQPLERLSQIYERQAPTPAADLQTELEQEALLGQTSQRRRRLAMQEAAMFAGSAGTTPTLASRARAGQF
jgi:hypothetical protein